MIQTLSDFLRATDANVRFYDLGHRLSKLPSETFHQFEQTEIPYPLPWLQQAWLAVLIWNPKQPGKQLIWFLRFPLDEQGKLVQAARDDFLQRLSRCVGQDLLATDSSEDPLKDNPFAFTPASDKMAAFHARVTQELSLPASNHYGAVRNYLQEDNTVAWQELGLQGIADLCARLDSDNNEQLLCEALPRINAEALAAIATQLEHVVPSHRIAAALSKRLAMAIQQENALITAALLRGLSQIHSDGMRRESINLALNSPLGSSVELLAAIASRCWADLLEPGLCHQFLERLACSEAGQQGFNRLVAELLYRPDMRNTLMSSLRMPERSDQLAAAIGGFFAALTPSR